MKTSTKETSSPARKSRRGIGGPKTRTGKSRSSLNAVKHGTWASQPITASKYFLAHRERYESLRDDLVLEHEPQGPSVYRCVEEIWSIFIKLDRLDEYRNSMSARLASLPRIALVEKLAKKKQDAEDNKNFIETHSQLFARYNELLELLRKLALPSEQADELKGYLDKFKEKLSYGLVNYERLPASFWNDFKIAKLQTDFSVALTKQLNERLAKAASSQAANASKSPDALKEKKISFERLVELLIASEALDLVSAKRAVASYDEDITDLTKQLNDPLSGTQNESKETSSFDMEDDENLDRCETNLLRRLDRAIDRLRRLKQMTQVVYEVEAEE